MIRFNMRYGPVLTLLLLLERCACESGGQYYGKELGALSQLHHGVRGRVYAIDSRTLYIRDFHYDGEGPAAYFYVGTSKSPVGGSEGGVRLRDERGGAGPLRRYRGEGITLALPDGKTLKDVKWFSVWCDEFSVNFGDVSIPRDVEYPRPVKVSALRGVHGVSSDPIVVVDAQTLLVPYFSYDGEAPDAKFWVGRGDKPSPQGIRIPDENGKEAPLRRYDRKTIVLTLPGELTVFDIGHFAVWCEAFTVNFGHVTLPRHLLSNVPPSLKMLGVSPQSRNKELSAQHESAPASPAAGRVRARRPLAPLDATTYRPHLRPGPLAALLDSPADRSPLHRRADSFTPPAQRPLDTPPQHETQSERKDDTDGKDTQQRHVYQDDLQTYRTQNHRRSERPHQTVDRQKSLPERYQQNENYQQQRSQELYYQEPPQYQSQVYQPQYSEQRLLHERLAYERRLLEERYRSQPQPQYQLHPQYQPQPQYRLVPYYSQPVTLA